MNKSDYEYIVKEDDTLSALSAKFYGNMKHYPCLAKYNNIQNPDVITVNQKILMPRTLLAGSEMQGDTSVLHLAIRRSSAIDSEGCIIRAYFENLSNQKIELTEAPFKSSNHPWSSK